MFCNKCGNQIPDGSSYCNFCGNGIGNPQNGFGGVAPYLTRKEYFKTACSQKAKNIIKAGKILLLVCSILLVASLVSAFVEAKSIFGEAYSEGDFKTVVARLEELSGESLGFTEQDYADIESIEAEFKKEFDMTFVEFFEVILYSIYAVIAVSALAVIILSYFTMRNISLVTSIIALVISFFFLGGLIAIGMTVTLLVLVCILRKEYKAYSENRYSFTNLSNEPDFSN